MASKTTAELMVKLTADASGLTKTLGDAASSTRNIEQSFATLGSSLQGVGKRLTMGLTLPLAAAAAVGIGELMEAGKVAAQTNAVLKSTGNVANTSAKQLDMMSAALMRKTGQDDEAIKSGANMMLTFKNVRNEVGAGNNVFDRSIELATDLSVAFGQDMVTSSKQLGKALDDPISGVTALRKVGVSFSADQREMIKSLVETGDVAGAQKIILKELETQVGGSAAAFGKTLPGQIAIAREEFKNATGAIMASFAPAMTIAADVAGGLATTISDLPGPMQALIGVLALVAGGVGPVIYVIGSLMKAFTGLSALMPKVIGALGAFVGPVAIVAGIVAVGIALHELGLGSRAVGEGMDDVAKQILKVSSSTAILKSFNSAVDDMRDQEVSSKGGILPALGIDVFSNEISESEKRMRAFQSLMKESPAAAQSLVAAMEASGESTGRFRRLLNDADIAQVNASTAANNLSEELVAQGRAAELTTSQINALTDALTTQANLDIAVEQAAINAQKATEEYNRVLGDGTSTTIDRAQATLNLEKAAVAQRDAIEAAADADKNGSISKQEQTDSTKRQIESLAVLAGAMEPGSPSRVRIEEMIAALQRLNNTPVRPTVDTNPAIYSIEALINKYAGIQFQFGVITAEGIAAVKGRRAAGGPVSGGSTYLVGEKGPELFTPSGSGVVIPNNKLAGGSSRASGGSTTNITINTVTGNPAEIERVVVDALARARRRGLSGVKV